MAQSTSAIPLIFDGHNDTILSLRKTGRTFFQRSTDGHIDLPRAREGALGGGFFASYIHDPVNVEKERAGADPEAAMSLYADERTWPEPMTLEYAQSHALSLLGHLLRIAETSQGEVQVVTTAAGLQRCLDTGVFAMLLHFEGAEPIDPEGYALEAFYAAGVRSVGLTHSRRNRFALGVPFKFPSSPDTGTGLADEGKELVRQLNRRRVMIDLSHLNEQGFWDVAQISDAPLVATHSNAHALSPSPRSTFTWGFCEMTAGARRRRLSPEWSTTSITWSAAWASIASPSGPTSTAPRCPPNCGMPPAFPRLSTPWSAAAIVETTCVSCSRVIGCVYCARPGGPRRSRPASSRETRSRRRFRPPSRSPPDPLE